MIMKMTMRDRFNWWLPFFSAIGALILFVPIMIYGINIPEDLYIYLVAPIISVILLVVAFRKKGLQRMAVLSMLVVYSAVSLSLYKNSHELRITARWLLWSKDLKAKILAQPNTANGELKHIDWGGWQYIGVDYISSYIVFAPSYSLSAAAKSHSPGKFSGIPCYVHRVRRLESHYYTVLFYSETDWGHC